MRKPNDPDTAQSERAARPPRPPRAGRGRYAVRTPYGGRARTASVAAVGLLLALAACGTSKNGSPEASSSAQMSGETASTSAGTQTPTATPTTSGPSPTGTPTMPPPPTHTSGPPRVTSCVNRVYDGMSQAQRVGQLFMSAITSTGMTTSESTAITQGKVGSVILMGHSTAGTSATARVTASAQRLAQSAHGIGVRMLVSTDQEGGLVQVLRGPGFSTIPSAVTQGTWSTGTLRSNAAAWARQLAAAGVNLDLAPVADTVPANLVSVNAPIGKLQRNYGNDPAQVASHSTAFLRGMLQSGVMTSAKHFPGLGRVVGNTDTTAGVKDTVTTRNDPYLQPFRSAVQAGTPFVMISSAIYTRIDAAHQGPFSSTVMRGMLRGSLGFQGVIISDDMGNAVALRDHTPAQRAVDFIAAGGNMVLTVRPSDIAPMTAAVLARAGSDAAFAKDVADSVHRVLVAKQAARLLGCG